jgi:PEP-CTERM motif
MSFRVGKIVLLVAVFALATSIAGFAQFPCGVPNEISCNTWDGGSNLIASQDDPNGFGQFATTYQIFKTLVGTTTDVDSFHFVGGYFNPPAQGQIIAWEVGMYNWQGSTTLGPGSSFYSTVIPGNGNETFIGSVNGFPMYLYDLTLPTSVDLPDGTYWVSVAPLLGFPPQWGWATGTDLVLGWQCFFGSCGNTVGLNLAVDGTPVSTTPEPGTLIMLGTGILGLAGSLRRKLL